MPSLAKHKTSVRPNGTWMLFGSPTDITTDNPNVWFELGYALASDKEVVLVCSKERTARFPFDVQHRSIITYAPESTSDFTKLTTDITTRLEAILKKRQGLDALAALPASPLKESEGLSQQEMVCLVVVMESSLTPGDTVGPFQIQKDMTRLGFTPVAVSLSLRSLLKKEMLETTEVYDQDSNDSATVYRIVQKGEDWLLSNQDKLVLRQEPKPTEEPQGGSSDIAF
jgi:hypothetical protein